MRAAFLGLYGNEATKKRLLSAITAKTLPHAFLICGQEGSGKKTLVREIAAALNCERRGDENSPLPCHTCNTCKRIFSDSFIDVKTLKRASDKQTVGVQETRVFREDMFLSSTESEYKIYIIEQADRMTVNAQNALLKVLEEPPEGVLIFLLTESDDAILTTIKSRTQYVAMERFEEAELADYLKKRGLISGNDEASTRLHDALMCADGRIGKALLIIGDGGMEEARSSRTLTDDIISALKQSTPYSSLFAALKALPSKRDELSAALENIILALRDLILLKFDTGAPLCFYSSREEAKALSESMNAKRLTRIYEIIKGAIEELSANVNVGALITSLGAKIKLI